MLLMGCLVHKSIYFSRHILYLVYLRLCLLSGLFAFTCDLFFIIILIFVELVYNLIKTDTLVFADRLEYILLFSSITTKNTEAATGGVL